MGCFSMFIGHNFAFQAELFGAMLAIEIAYSKGWHNLWLECDFMLVIFAFSSPHMVLWKVRNRWDNCLLFLKDMNFCYSHIYQEGNHCADKLASFGINIMTIIGGTLPDISLRGIFIVVD